MNLVVTHRRSSVKGFCEGVQWKSSVKEFSILQRCIRKWFANNVRPDFCCLKIPSSTHNSNLLFRISNWKILCNLQVAAGIEWRASFSFRIDTFLMRNMLAIEIHLNSAKWLGNPEFFMVICVTVISYGGVNVPSYICRVAKCHSDYSQTLPKSLKI